MFEIKVLSREAVEKVLDIHKVIECVKQVYLLKSQGDTAVFPTVVHDFIEGRADMDIKSGHIKGADIYGMKSVSWFGDNEEKGLPTLIGVLSVFDANTGRPLGILDAAYITCMRTGAAGSIGAKLLARADSENLLIVGAGNQAAFQIAGTLAQMPGIKKVRIYDGLSYENAQAMAGGIRKRLEEQFGLSVNPDVVFEAVKHVEHGVADSDIIITVTPSREPIIKAEWVRPGTHFSCIGADMAGKEEIEEEIFRGARIFADDKKQCMNAGESELPIKHGVITEADFAGEIGDLLLGKVEGRQSVEQITIFDATGMALLDLITAKEALEAAQRLGLGATAEI